MAKGGKRQGAGVKKDSIRPKFTAYWSQEEIEDYMTWLKQNYKDKPELAKYIGDHLFGKAPQPISNDGDNPFKIEGNFVKFI